MAKSKSSNLKSSILDITACVTAVISLLFLCININNWASIARGSSDIGRYLASVGVDAPLLFPLIVGYTLIFISWIIYRRTLTKLQLVALTILAVVTIIWFLGLGADTRNPLQQYLGY